MDTVSYCVAKIKQVIPRQLLDEAFKPQRYDPVRQVRRYDNVLAQSIDDLIRTHVIEGVVALDLDQFAGTEDLVLMSLADRIVYDPWNLVFRFDPKVLGGRRIIKVHEVLFGYNVGHGTSTYGNQGPSRNLIGNVTRDIQRATSGVSSSGTAYVELIGPNTVLINDINIVSGYSTLRCTLTYDKTFNEIKPEYRKTIADLCILATKQYIYNTLIIDVDEGIIRSGKTIGMFKQLIDSYSDALQIYDEMIDVTMLKISILNDTEQKRKVMKLAIGSRTKFG